MTKMCLWIDNNEVFGNLIKNIILKEDLFISQISQNKL